MPIRPLRRPRARARRPAPPARAAERARPSTSTSPASAVGKMTLDTEPTGQRYTRREPHRHRRAWSGCSPTSASTASRGGRDRAATAPWSRRASRRTRSRPRADRDTDIDWEDGTPVSVSVEPPRESAPDPAAQAGTLDPVSAGFAVLRDRAGRELCDTTVEVFDGSRRSRLAARRRRSPTATPSSAPAPTPASRARRTASPSQREFPSSWSSPGTPNGDRPARAHRDRHQLRPGGARAAELSRPAVPALPIEPVLPALAAALAEAGRAVLQAPPGAGKTTRVPLHLLDAGTPGRILMLEPRRVAARAAAERLAEGLGEAVGRPRRLPHPRRGGAGQPHRGGDRRHPDPDDPVRPGAARRRLPDLRRVPRARAAGRPRSRAGARDPRGAPARPAAPGDVGDARRRARWRR